MHKSAKTSAAKRVWIAAYPSGAVHSAPPRSGFIDRVDHSEANGGESFAFIREVCLLDFTSLQ